MVLLFLVTTAVRAQEPTSPVTKRVIVKTNVLSLLALRPTISVEKAFTRTFSTEVSFVQGEYNKILYTDHYDYHGFLVRAKKHLLVDLDYGAVSPFVAVYVGNLKRHIQTTGKPCLFGYPQPCLIGYPARDFSANSIRGGGSFGYTYIAKSKFFLDAQGSLGYGRYLNIDTADPDTYSKGYTDIQLWLSLGHCF